MMYVCVCVCVCVGGGGGEVDQKLMPTNGGGGPTKVEDPRDFL